MPPVKRSATRTAQRSPLALVVLALLSEKPMHPYRMHELIRQRGKDVVVNVAQRNSVYQTVDRLLRNAWIRVQQTVQAGGPERVVYEITDEGRAVLEGWMRELLAVPAREFPEFPAALAFLPVLSPREAHRQLEQRVAALEGKREELRQKGEAAAELGIPRLFLVEDEYREAMLDAELVWVRGLVAALRSRELTWSAAWLRRIAARFNDDA